MILIEGSTKSLSGEKKNVTKNEVTLRGLVTKNVTKTEVTLRGLIKKNVTKTEVTWRGLVFCKNAYFCVSG